MVRGARRAGRRPRAQPDGRAVAGGGPRGDRHDHGADRESPVADGRSSLLTCRSLTLIHPPIGPRPGYILLSLLRLVPTP
eukprot:2421224-Pyramimonas_sp.AAC.1